MPNLSTFQGSKIVHEFAYFFIQGDLSGRPSSQVPRIRKRPLKKQQQRKRQRLGNLPRRRVDPGKSRNFLGNIMDMDILGLLAISLT